MTLQSITSLQHQLVKHLTKLRQQRSYRKECGHLVVEGKKLIHDIHSQVEIHAILTTNTSFIPDKISYKSGYQVTDSIIEKITGSVSPEGIVAEITIPQQQPIDHYESLVVLDRIQDPGNVGTIIRTALAFGWKGIYCIEGTCDVWNDKVIRSARGASFQIPFQYGSWQQLLELVNNAGATVYAADLGGEAINTLSTPSGPIVLVLGNEGQGLSQEASKNCHKITIPISHAIESLNVSVAGGILMYHLRGKDHG
ncbi:MAG: RNA methyltransferase [Chlamydiota bacterium]